MAREVVAYKNAIKSAETHFLDVARSTGNLVTYKREALFAMQAIEKNSALMSCSFQSIRDAVINIASIGLSLNPAEAMAYMVPRKGECCLDISYRGLLKIATDTGSVSSVIADVVHSTDVFVFKNKMEIPEHEYSPFASSEERGPIIGAYCVARLHDGSVLVEVIGREELERIRDASNSKSKPAWEHWFGEMAKKSVIKRARKMWPASSRLDSAVHVLNEHEGLAPETAAADPYAVSAKSDAPVDVDPETGEVMGDDAGPVEGLTDGQLRVVRSKLEAVGVSPEALFAQFGVSEFNQLARSQTNDVLAWIGEQV